VLRLRPRGACIPLYSDKRLFSIFAPCSDILCTCVLVFVRVFLSMFISILYCHCLHLYDFVYCRCLKLYCMLYIASIVVYIYVYYTLCDDIYMYICLSVLMHPLLSFFLCLLSSGWSVMLLPQRYPRGKTTSNKNQIQQTQQKKFPHTRSDLSDP